MAYTAKKTEEKRPIIEEISSNVKDADAVVLVHYSGISVEADTELRKELREAGIIYKVYKNTMMNFAFQGTEFEPLSKHLEGRMRTPSPRMTRLHRPVLFPNTTRKPPP